MSVNEFQDLHNRAGEYRDDDIVVDLKGKRFNDGRNDRSHEPDRQGKGRGVGRGVGEMADDDRDNDARCQTGNGAFEGLTEKTDFPDELSDDGGNRIADDEKRNGSNEDIFAVDDERQQRSQEEVGSAGEGVEFPFSQERTENDDKNVFHPIYLQAEKIDGDEDQRNPGKQYQGPVFGYEIIRDRDGEPDEVDELAANFRA